MSIVLGLEQEHSCINGWTLILFMFYVNLVHYIYIYIF